MRRILGSLAAIALALALAGPASAAITGSNVTTPSGTFYLLVDPDAGQTLHVAGTTTGGSPGDKVKIACVRGGGVIQAQFGDAQPIDDSGGFSADVPLDDFNSRTACEIQALPPAALTGDPPGGSPRQFSGPRANLGVRIFEHLGNDPSRPIDAVVLATQKAAAEWEHLQTGLCAISDALLTQPGSLLQSDLPFWCNAALRETDEGDNPGARSQLVIDKTNAYLPASAASVNDDASNPPSPVVTYKYSPKHGDLAIHSVEPAVKCKPDTSFPATPAKCAEFVPLGVSIDTRITDRGRGTTSRVVQKFTSTDGHKHALDLLFDNQIHTATRNGGVRFPWFDSGYKPRDSGDAIAGPPSTGPGAIFVKSDRSGTEGTLAGVQGSIVFASGPRRVRFIRATDSSEEYGDFELAYKRTVKPKAPQWFGWTFGLSTRSAALVKAARTAQRAFRPRVKIKTPRKGASTRRRTVTVRGTSHDASGRVKVRVNGRRANVKQNGSWRLKVKLKLGSNRLTAKATNRYGNSTRAHRSIVRRAHRPQ